MSRARWSSSVCALSVALVMACSGESTSSDDGDSGGGTGGSSATGGTSTGGTSTGGTSTGGTSTGGTSTGGTSGTGGAPPDGTCDDIVPCGGDPTGTWVVRENCTEVLVAGLFDAPGCEDVVAAGSGVLEGTFTFDNGMATQDTTLTTYVTVVINDACARGLTELPDVTAVELCPLIGQLMMDPETALTCAAANGDCRCDGTQAPTVSMQTDTYEVVGTQLILGSGDTFDFCVEGDSMGLSGTTVDPQSGAVAELMVGLDRQ